MDIWEDLLTVNKYSRPGKKLAEVLGFVIHWVANPMSTPKQNRDYFELRKNGEHGYGSAHFIVGIDGDIIQCIPENEVAYHCGTSRPISPNSTQIYTDMARTVFGKYCQSPTSNSPNNCTIGIEMCHPDWSGEFTNDTLEATSEVLRHLINKYNKKDILTHNEVVGWKDCPRWFVEHPSELSQYLNHVMDGC